MERDHDQRPAARQISQNRAEAEHPIGLEICKRFVEQQQSRTRRERPRHQDPRPLASREAVDRAIGESGEFEQFDELGEATIVVRAEAERDHVARRDRPAKVA